MSAIPDSVQRALDRKKNAFWGHDGAEWKIEIEKDGAHIEKHVGTPVLIFANNGYGDFLFLKKGENGSYVQGVFEFLHEGPSIEKLKEDLDALLENKARKPSMDSYPAAHYESGERVLLGDRVQFKTWALFWQGWLDGVVTYVPGISPLNTKYEFNGLKWIEIKRNDITVDSLIDPKSGTTKKIRFVCRLNP